MFSGASVEAVGVVVGSIDDLADGDVDPLDGLASLLDKSLIRLIETDDGGSRLFMLETIREYAVERLHDSPALDAAGWRAHAAYFADFAHRRWRDLTGRQRQIALAPKIENLRTAWRHWVVERDLEQLDKLVDSLWLLYEMRGSYQSTIELTTDLLGLLAEVPSTSERIEQRVTLQTSLARALLAVKG